MPFSRLLIVDNNFKSVAGHHYEYARAVREAALQRGLIVRLAIHRDAPPEVCDELNALPVFRWGAYDPMLIDQQRHPVIGKAINGVLFNYYFLRDWRKSGLSADIDSQTLVFIPNCIEMMVFGIVLWLRLRPKSRRPKMVCLFRRDPRVLMPLAGKLLKPLLDAGTVMLTTDSDTCAEQYERATGLKFTVLPIPHQPFPSREGVGKIDDRSIIRMTFLGDARLEKGFDILVRAIPLIKEEMERKKVVFLLQCNVVHEEPGMATALKQLADVRDQFSDSVRLFPMALSTSEYFDLLLDSHFILVPYRRQNYQARTSGILAEAIAAGKPAIVTSETWMARQLAHHGAGVCFNDGDAEDLARALRKAIHESPKLVEEAKKKAVDWRQFHTAGRLVDMLLSHWD